MPANLRSPLILALVLGALAATGFAPLGLWPVTLACLAKLICIASSEQESGKRAFLIGWSFGVGHFTVGNNWIAHAFTYQDAMPHWLGYGAVVALALYLAVYPGLATLGLFLARRRWPDLHAVPLFAALWVATEYGRATIFTGFAWDPIGMIWLGTGVDQAARLIGTYGLSALAILAAGAALALSRRRWRTAVPTLAAFVLLAVAGQFLAAPDRAETGVPITVVQPNINQNEKYDPALEQANFAKLAQLTKSGSGERSRLVFWPEAAVPAWLDIEPEWRARIARLLRPGDLLLLGGSKVYFAPGQYGRKLAGANNSAWVLTPEGGLAARYDKAHLVPYGEYLPMRGLLEPLGLSRLVPGDADFWPGPGPGSLPLAAAPGRMPLKAGVQICYEIIFSGQVVDRRDRPAFLFNPSNDAWFGSWGPPQHLAQARMRAIEEAMPVIRSTPTGISAVIDGAGNLIAHIPHHEAGAINVDLPVSRPPTPFAMIGNWLPAAFALLLLGVAALPLALARRKG